MIHDMYNNVESCQWADHGELFNIFKNWNNILLVIFIYISQLTRKSWMLNWPHLSKGTQEKWKAAFQLHMMTVTIQWQHIYVHVFNIIERYIIYV